MLEIYECIDKECELVHQYLCAMWDECELDDLLGNAA